MLIRIYPENPNPREMAKALKMLRDGELIIYPTDTVYAIGCDALNVRAVEKICALKGVNPQKSNLSIICYDLSNISEYAQVSNAAFKLLKKNLPGPFTFILPTSSRLPKIYKNKKEVGIRVPDNSIARGLVDGLGNPILTMSVHDEDEIIEYSTDPELIHEKYEGRVALVIDGGYGGSEASTVVNCVDDASRSYVRAKASFSFRKARLVTLCLFLQFILSSTATLSRSGEGYGSGFPLSFPGLSRFHHRNGRKSFPVPPIPNRTARGGFSFHRLFVPHVRQKAACGS